MSECKFVRSNLLIMVRFFGNTKFFFWISTFFHKSSNTIQSLRGIPPLYIALKEKKIANKRKGNHSHTIPSISYTPAKTKQVLKLSLNWAENLPRKVPTIT